MSETKPLTAEQLAQIRVGLVKRLGVATVNCLTDENVRRIYEIENRYTQTAGNDNIDEEGGPLAIRQTDVEETEMPPIDGQT